MMKRHQMFIVLLMVLLMGVSSQAILAAGDTEGVVNNLCPIMKSEIDSDKVPAELTRDFMDQKVGFCCTSCLAKWDELKPSEKTEKLKAVVSDKM